MNALTEVLTQDGRSVRLGDTVAEVWRDPGNALALGREGRVVGLIDCNAVTVLFQNGRQVVCYADYLAVLPRVARLR